MARIHWVVHCRAIVPAVRASAMPPQFECHSAIQREAPPIPVRGRHGQTAYAATTREDRFSLIASPPNPLASEKGTARSIRILAELLKCRRQPGGHTPPRP